MPRFRNNCIPRRDIYMHTYIPDVMLDYLPCAKALSNKMIQTARHLKTELEILYVQFSGFLTGGGEGGREEVPALLPRIINIFIPSVQPQP